MDMLDATMEANENPFYLWLKDEYPQLYKNWLKPYTLIPDHYTLDEVVEMMKEAYERGRHA